MGGMAKRRGRGGSGPCRFLEGARRRLWKVGAAMEGEGHSFSSDFSLEHSSTTSASGVGDSWVLR